MGLIDVFNPDNCNTLMGMAMLDKKVAVVTGAATGIGEAIARLFVEEGAQVCCWDRNAQKNEEAASRMGRGARAMTVDVADGARVRAAMNEAVAQLGRVDILINNAGIFPRRSFLEMTEQDWDDMQNVNLKSMFHCIQAAAPGMLERGSGKIVTISSVTFHLGVAGLTHYVASKGGVIGLTRSLAREFGEKNVHINCITPGAINSESEKNFVSAEQIAVFLGNQSIKRRITPLDVARVALFLSSELSDSMTGQTLNVDGGWAMH
ncbi:MAG: 3-oxoacyl-ACP reductase FabG [Acidobacteriaceae bacterium]|nr:3-oxoacyl-ACP reductase FabG [Acidobacteriaceae bacterium]